jgi:acetyl coenzyme A synthetase (ADP forming)-like protein
MTRSLKYIFSPSSVAVVGASRDRGSISYALLHNLIVNEFEGPIYPVNPKATVVHSLRCYPSVSAIPDPVDLAVILVPRDFVLPAVEECMAKGIRGLVVISAGFGESSAEGARLEKQLVEQIRAHGARMVGPNCMGVLNTDPGVKMNATFAPARARPGPIGFVSQSGALGVAILNEAEGLGIGFTQFASMGNKADVSGNDLLEYWESDPKTRVIAMYLESFGNPRRFTEIIKRVGRNKPILVVKAGRTEAGARAASSHTGALASRDVTDTAFLRQCGVLRANTIQEMFDTARALSRCPLPAGNRVCIVTNAGGPAIMATDACENSGLVMAVLSEETESALRSFLPPEASARNPVDMIASGTAPTYRKALAAVLADPGVDMALAIYVTPLPVDPGHVLDEVTRTAGEFPGKPVLAVIMATEEFYEGLRHQEEPVPVYRFPESAVRSMAMLHRYAAWRSRPPEDPPRFEVDDAAVAAVLDREPGGYLAPASTVRVLDAYGIPTAKGRVVATPEEALEAAAMIGYPVVVKAVVPKVTHKSDLGGVALDIRNEKELSQAVRTMTDRLAAGGKQPEGFFVQELVRGGQEVIFGVSTTPGSVPSSCSGSAASTSRS